MGIGVQAIVLKDVRVQLPQAVNIFIDGKIGNLPGDGMKVIDHGGDIFEDGSGFGFAAFEDRETEIFQPRRWRIVWRAPDGARALEEIVEMTEVVLSNQLCDEHPAAAQEAGDFLGGK